jgi:hypothetical protein
MQIPEHKKRDWLKRLSLLFLLQKELFRNFFSDFFNDCGNTFEVFIT